MTLQSFVRGEIARGEFRAMAELLKQDAQVKLDPQLSAVVQIQSVIRGWLARKQFGRLCNSKVVIYEKRKRGRRLSEMMGIPLVDLPSSIEELHKRVTTAEANLGKKEKENAALRDQVQQYEVRWLEYEAKMKSMEDTWQKQMVSLQMSVAAAKKSLGTDQTALQGGKHECSPSPRYYESEDGMSMGAQTPGGSTPIKLGSNGFDIGPGREINARLNSIGHLAKEFEHRKQNFDEEAEAIAEIKSGQNPYEELRKLKQKFEIWKKDYKVRLREAKAKLHKLGHLEGERIRRKWWGKKYKKS